MIKGSKRTKDSIELGLQTRAERSKERGYYHSPESREKAVATRAKHADERGYYVSNEQKKQASETLRGKCYRTAEGEATRVAKLIATNAKNRQYKTLLCERSGCINTFKVLVNDKQKFCSPKCYQLWRSSLTKENCSFLRSASQKLTGRKQSHESIVKRLQSNCKRPNKFETNALNYLNIYFLDKFKYTGDGSFIRNNRSADAVAEDIKTIALFHGIYFHWLIKHPKIEITEADRRSIEKVDSLPFLAAGYKVIFIWEDELNQILKNNFDRSIVREYIDMLRMFL